jgi:hypothetical protein
LPLAHLGNAVLTDLPLYAVLLQESADSEIRVIFDHMFCTMGSIRDSFRQEVKLPKDILKAIC